ncbi:MAG TPA: hypothetical protein VK508_08395 [Cyclobacteriaceae bacterium]|nr:hypothetical protein [Cyclobacteriaceae bacterium]
MKTKTILFMAAVLISSVAFADEPGTPKLVVMSQNESGLYKVIYESPKASRVKMTILNSNGQTLYTESIKITDGFILPLNFKGLTPGEYSIEVTDGSGTQVQKVSYLTTLKAQRIHVAKLSSEANKYLLSVASEGVVSVRILDGAANIVHEQEFNVAGGVGVVYNLKGVVGAPTFEVTDSQGAVKTIRY